MISHSGSWTHLDIWIKLTNELNTPRVLSLLGLYDACTVKGVGLALS